MKKLLGILTITLLMGGFLAISNENFLGSTNLQNQARQISFLGLLGIGVALVIISGGIDLSVGSVVCVTATLTTWLVAEHRWSPWTASLLSMGLALLLGLWQGLLVTRVRIQPFIVTLVGLMSLRGVAQVITNGGAVSIGVGHPVFEKLGKGFILGGLPVSTAIMLAVAGVFFFVLHFTVFGRQLYALGNNEEAARWSGVPVEWRRLAAYVISSGIAGLVGVLHCSYLSSIQPSTVGQAYELYAIAAAVLGGCSLRGGEGMVVGVLVGATLMQLIRNAINLQGLSSFWEQPVTGAVILAAALLDVFVYQRGARRKA